MQFLGRLLILLKCQLLPFTSLLRVALPAQIMRQDVVVQRAQRGAARDGESFTTVGWRKLPTCLCYRPDR